MDKSSTDASGATSSSIPGDGGASGFVESPFPEMSEVRDSSKAGRCFDNPERSDSRIVDNSVLRGGSGLNVTTGGPRSAKNKLSCGATCPGEIKRTHFPVQSWRGWMRWLLGVGAKGDIVNNKPCIGLGMRRNRNHGRVVIVIRARELTRVLAFDGDAGTSARCETAEGVLQRSGNGRARNRLCRAEGKEVAKGT